MRHSLPFFDVVARRRLLLRFVGVRRRRERIGIRNGFQGSSFIHLLLPMRMKQRGRATTKSFSFEQPRVLQNKGRRRGGHSNDAAGEQCRHYSCKPRACVYLFLFLFCGERTAQFVGESNALVTKNNRERRTIMGGRRKNPNPKRAENARTVLKGEHVPEERGGEEEEEEEPNEVLLCLRIPDEDEVNEQMRKEEMTVRKGAKRKRGQHECGVCEKVFVSASKLAIHVRIHTNERPYECDVCEKCFRDSSDLKKHMRIHTNEKPYECDVCEKRFRESGNLQKHMRNVH